LIKTINGAARMAQVAHMGDRRGHLDFFYVFPEAGVERFHSFQQCLGAIGLGLVILLGRDRLPGLRILEINDHHL